MLKQTEKQFKNYANWMTREHFYAIKLKSTIKQLRAEDFIK